MRLVSFRTPLCPCPFVLPSTIRPSGRNTTILTGAICRNVANSFNNLRVPRVCASGVMLRRKHLLAVRKGTSTNRGMAISVSERRLRTIAKTSKG